MTPATGRGRSMRLAGVLFGAAGALLCLGRAFTAFYARRTERVYPATGSFVDVGGARLHIIDRGPEDPPRSPAEELSPRPAVVLIHGLRGSTAEYVFSVADDLASRYRVLAVDRPGCGYSSALAEQPGSPLSQAQALHTALRRLDVRRPILVGHSLGAALAMTYATQYPDDTAAVVTLSGHALPFDGPIGGSSRIAHVPLVGRLLVVTLVTPVGVLVGPRALRRTMRPQQPTRAYTRAALGMALRPPAFQGAAADARECDSGLRAVYRRYAALSVPVVVLHGSADRTISPNESLTLTRLLQHAEYIEVPGAGHMPFFADPAAVSAAVDRAAQLSARRS